MNISKINSTPFKGKLIFFNPEAKDNAPFLQSTVTFDTDNIESIVDSKDNKVTMIIGKDSVSNRDMRYKIPYNAVSPEEVLAAYTAAKQSDDARINISTRNLPIDPHEFII